MIVDTNRQIHRREPFRVVEGDILYATLKISHNAFRTNPGKPIGFKVVSTPYPLDFGWRIETEVGDFDIKHGEYVWVYDKDQ